MFVVTHVPLMAVEYIDAWIQACTHTLCTHLHAHSVLIEVKSNLASGSQQETNTVIFVRTPIAGENLQVTVT